MKEKLVGLTTPPATLLVAQEIPANVSERKHLLFRQSSANKGAVKPEKSKLEVKSKLKKHTSALDLKFKIQAVNVTKFRAFVGSTERETDNRYEAEGIVIKNICQYKIWHSEIIGFEVNCLLSESFYRTNQVFTNSKSAKICEKLAQNTPFVCA